MSADMMIITREDDSGFRGKGSDMAIQIDETSMGEPWTEFGKWFGQRYCKAPGLAEQMMGIKEHDFVEFTPEDALACKAALERMEHADYVEPSAFDGLVGKHISTENW